MSLVQTILYSRRNYAPGGAQEGSKTTKIQHFVQKACQKMGSRHGDQAVQTEPAPRGRQACRANGCHTPRTPMNLLSDFRTPRAGEAPQRPIGFGQRTRWSC